MQRLSIIRIVVIAVAMLLMMTVLASGGDADKASVSVGKIVSKADKCSSGTAADIGTMLMNTLIESGRFVERDNSDVVISGEVKEFDPHVKQGGALGSLKKKALGTAGAEGRSAKLKWELTLTDVASGKEIKKLKIDAKSTDWSVNAAKSELSGEIGALGQVEQYSGEPMEDAIKELISNTVNEIKKELPGEYFRYTGEEMAATSEDTPKTASAGDSETGTPAAPGAAAEDMKLYTKYDFVPGDRVIFYDDMKSDEEGEFPWRWNLKQGVFEVVKLGKEFWIMATDNGTVSPKIPKGHLPEKYTVELEFYDNGTDKSGNYFYIRWVDGAGKIVGEFGIVSGNDTWLNLQGHSLASKVLPQRIGKGVNTMRIMATSRSMKCYINEERVANVPKVEGFSPEGFELYLRPYRDLENPTLFRGFRFAEGGKSMREQLDETGKIVTHGILFDSGKHTIKAESYKTLKEIGELLIDDPTLKLSIEGHTDSDGADDYNMTLSNDRAQSVKSYLTSSFGIDGSRLESKGWGETKPIDTNDSPEGKANNRRVELVKI
ncbi:MAG: OmpA family protein [candidate division Zixibacteria bacterium]|nr:OmpA family protein [candidate division Zixibacteria bacterium]MBU1470766.1 OmpA family protein [candidate division Zixibacteria bacterium]MBU2625288.1 OmpA family protein [candidate division Zixibacteria bacterium]